MEKAFRNRLNNVLWRTIKNLVREDERVVVIVSNRILA